LISGNDAVLSLNRGKRVEAKHDDDIAEVRNAPSVK
jgi:hypothetical protein